MSIRFTPHTYNDRGSGRYKTARTGDLVPIQVSGQRVPHEGCRRNLVQYPRARMPGRGHGVAVMRLRCINAFDGISIARHAIHLRGLGTRDKLNRKSEDLLLHKAGQQA